MSISEQMMLVLSQSSRLTPNNYEFLLESLSQAPKFLSHLTQHENREWLFDLLTSHSDRLVNLFQRIHAAPPSVIATDLRYGLAEQTAQLFIETMPDLYDALEDITVTELLTPALALCLDQKPLCLQRLAPYMSTRTSILQTLSANESSGQAIKSWAANASYLMPRKPDVLEVWTNTLMHMAENCLPDQHGASKQLHQFKMLTQLKKGLREYIEKFDLRMSSAPFQMPTIDKMKALQKDDKKSNRAKRDGNERYLPKIDTSLQALLVGFDLEIPHSIRTAQHVINQLEIDRTCEILAFIAATFPCSRCKLALESGSMPGEIFDQTPESTLPATDLSLDVFGTQIGTWKVLLSQTALKSFQCLNQLDSVRSKLVDLSRMCAKHRRVGSEEQQKRLRVVLFETKCGKDLFILWQIDVGDDSEVGMLRQEVKVWEIGNRKEIAKAIDSAVVLQQNYSEKTIHQIRQRPVSRDNPLPVRFKKQDWIKDTSPEQSHTLDVRLLDQETIDMANKFFMLTEPVLRSILTNNVSAQFPFDLSSEETEIIKYFQTSSLILGRSGTGKTTCLVFKLVAKFLTSRSTDEKPIRQVLLTRSSQLAQKLQSYTSQLIRTLDIPSEHVLVATNLQQTGHQKSEGDIIVDTALTLREQSFPLICTFDCFLQILENTVKAMDRKNFEGFGGFTRLDSSRLSRVTRKAVDYNSFRLDYWPHFPSILTKKLSTALVFSEIMGVIKGSSSSAETLEYLSRNAYLTRSPRQAPVFSEKIRPLVYDIFKHYEDLKLKRNELDDADRVMKILSAVRGNAGLKRLLGSKFNEIYVDEVQDQRTVDIELFLSFINDSRAFHFAGDTAQAIANDSTFRFEDIRALLYKHFNTASEVMNQNRLAKPILFKLAKNYRSHRGILRVASLVMDLLWRGYPDAVDRLGPEIGQLFGPMPTIFIGCDTSLLTSTNVGHVNLAGNTTDFGAEQVILVRDEIMKSELRDCIGDAALVLTILQSKGMEFDDVILWEFFSRCPNDNGVRNLRSLLEADRAPTYAREHADMCTELKRLYVAVTRARIQLFLIESSEKIMRSVIDLFQCGGKQPIVDVTSRGDHLFEEKLRSLRPGYSVDPRRWSLRGDQFMQASNFNDALFCFRKAKDPRGIMRAQAEIHAETGRFCKASGDAEGSIMAFIAAKELFMELNLVSEAATILEAMDRTVDAAQLWMEQGSFGKAAALFCQANIWLKAADCHECDNDYEAAATVLRRGNEVDALVVFLCKRKSQLDANCLQRFTRLCKLLLKQGRISVDNRKQAISLLGSLSEQEIYFREYDMHAELADVYEAQYRYADIYLLQIRIGELEAALKTALKYNVSSGSYGIAESHVIHLMDYVFTEKKVRSLRKNEGLKQYEEFEVNQESLTPKMAARLGQWEILNNSPLWESSTKAHEVFEDAKKSNMSAIISLLSIEYSDITADCTRLADLPCNILLEAIDVISKVVFKGDPKAKSALMMVNGLGSEVLFGQDKIILPWSPFAEPNADAQNPSPCPELLALQKLSSAISAFESKAWNIWKARVTRTCSTYLSRGVCDSTGCPRSHKPITPSECAGLMTDLQSIVHVVCGMTKLYYRHILPEVFQSGFLKMKRRWLEPLISQLTYVSALEQDFNTVTVGRHSVISGRMPPATIGSIEDLLFVRIRTEWEKRKLYSRLLEEIQVAELLDINFKPRFYRALAHKILSDVDMRRITLPRLLKEAAKSRNPKRFQGLLSDFVNVLVKTETSHMKSLYSVVTELESLAVFLIMVVCSPVSLLPYSWLMANASWMMDSKSPVQSVDFGVKTIFTRCLFSLAEGFCGLLRRLERFPLQANPDDRPAFSVDLLRQRNAELLALVSVNLAAEKDLKFGSNETWKQIKETFPSFYSKATDYQTSVKNPEDLQERLQKSFSRYGGKNVLVLLAKVPPKSSPFTNFGDAKVVTYDALSTLSVTQAPMTASPGGIDQFSADDISSIGKIQQFWKKWSPRFKRHQEYLKSSEAQAVAKCIALGSRPPASLHMRAVLVSEGPALYLRSNSVKDMISPLRKRVLEGIESAEDSDYRCDVLETALHQCATIEDALKEITLMMSEDKMRALIATGRVPEMSRAMSSITKTLGGVEAKINAVQQALSP